MQELSKTGPLSRRGFLGAAAVAAVPVGATLLGAGSAAATTRPFPTPATVVKVTVSTDGVTVSPTRIPAGVVTVEVVTPDAANRSVGLIKLHDGVALESFMDHYVQATNPDPVLRRQALAQIDSEASYLGGANVTAASGPVRSTSIVTPGTYQIFTYTAVGTPTYRQSIAALEVVSAGAPVGRIAGVPTLVAAYDDGPIARYLIPRDLPACGEILFANQGSQLNELQFIAVRPGTAEAEVQAFFDALRSGQAPPSNPFVSSPAGLCPITPGSAALLSTKLPAGPYLAACFISNRTTLMKRAFEGTWALVNLR